MREEEHGNLHTLSCDRLLNKDKSKERVLRSVTGKFFTGS